MKLPDCRRALAAELREPLYALGFAKDVDALSFRRSNLDRHQTLRFPARKSEDGRCFFSAIAGIRFEEIERILRSPSETADSATIMTPLHLLHSDRKFSEWSMATIDDSRGVGAAILEEVHRYALPFFESYSRIENLKATLESSGPIESFVISPNQKTCLLAAIEFSSGNSEAALRILDQALAGRTDMYPARRRPLEEMRRRLASWL